MAGQMEIVPRQISAQRFCGGAIALDQNPHLYLTNRTLTVPVPEDVCKYTTVLPGMNRYGLLVASLQNGAPERGATMASWTEEEMMSWSGRERSVQTFKSQESVFLIATLLQPNGATTGVQFCGSTSTSWISKGAGIGEREWLLNLC